MGRYGDYVNTFHSDSPDEKLAKRKDIIGRMVSLLKLAGANQIEITEMGYHVVDNQFVLTLKGDMKSDATSKGFARVVERVEPPTVHLDQGNGEEGTLFVPGM